MATGVVTYAYQSPDDTGVRDFLNGPLLVEYCAGHAKPLVLTAIDVQELADFLYLCVEEGRISPDRRRLVVDWLNGIATAGSVFIGAVE